MGPNSARLMSKYKEETPKHRVCFVPSGVRWEGGLNQKPTTETVLSASLQNSEKDRRFEALRPAVFP